MKKMTLNELRQYVKSEAVKLFEADIIKEEPGAMDAKAVMFCQGVLSESEFYKHIDEALSENWFSDTKNWIIEKVVKVLYTFIQQGAKIGYSILGKVISAAQYIIGKINNFADKNPALWKAIIIVVVLFVAFVVAAGSAKASTTGNPPDQNLINQAIGFVKGSKGIDDNNLKMKIIAYLVDIRDGHQDISSGTYGQKVVDMANAGMNTIRSMTKAGGPENSGLMTMLADYANQGAELAKSTIETVGGKEVVKLAYKENRII